MNPWNAQIFAPFFAKMDRRADLLKIVKPKGIGIELGVAEGHFSAEILATRRLRYLYSVDMYAGDRGHDVDQYISAIQTLTPFRGRSSILKMKFDEASGIFSDDYFDFIYVDGYAHTGEEEGTTFTDWFPKLKSGAVLGGHDYSPKCPLVVEQVDAFASKMNLSLHVINDPSEGWNNGCSSWFVIKP